MNILFWCRGRGPWTVLQHSSPLTGVILISGFWFASCREKRNWKSKNIKKRRKRKRRPGLCSLPFPMSDIRCPLMCVLQMRSAPVCSWKSSERVGSVQLDWFAGAHFSAAALAGCLQSSLSPFELLLQAAQETEAFIFHKECDLTFFLLNNCQLDSPADDECPADNIFSVSLLDFQVCICYTDVFALICFGFQTGVCHWVNILTPCLVFRFFFRLTQV